MRNVEGSGRSIKQGVIRKLLSLDDTEKFVFASDARDVVHVKNDGMRSQARPVARIDVLACPLRVRVKISIPMHTSLRRPACERCPNPTHGLRRLRSHYALR